jgi:16S rRNA (uracil1498-N3)-methyltransferase
VERSRYSTMTTFFTHEIHAGSNDLGEEAAHHARVKRLAPGDPVRLVNGEGCIGDGWLESLGKKSIVVDVQNARSIDRPPAIHLCVPVADKDRTLWLAEKVAELQVESWIPVMYSRSRSVASRGEGDAFGRKVLARMIAALEQSGGAWLPTIHPMRSAEEIAEEMRGLVLEKRGTRMGRLPIVPPVTIAIGPEGGFEPEELGLFEDRGWKTAALGDVTLRFETAAIGAVAVARGALISEVHDGELPIL